MSESTMATELLNVPLTKTKRTVASQHGRRAVVTMEASGGLWMEGMLLRTQGCRCKEL